jgi:hypothetical protein
MTDGKFTEGYNLIKDMQESEFLSALRMLAEHEVMVKKLSDFRERHKSKEFESIAALLTRTAEEGNEEAISLLAAGALERQV